MSFRIKYGLHLRTVDESDAAFILGLRTDERLSRFLSETSVSIEDQIEWIGQYKQRERKGEEYYFISLDGEGNRLGLNRLCNFDADSFEAGSWLFRRGLDTGIPVLGDLATRDFGFEELHFDSCRFEVLRGNEAVVKYHRGFRPELVGEDERAYYFRLSRPAYEVYRNKLLKIFFHE